VLIVLFCNRCKKETCWQQKSGRNKPLTQENNINTREKVDNSAVQTQNQSIPARTKKDTTIDNEAWNAGKLLSKIAQCNPNQCGKKDKTVHAMQKEFAESDSSEKSVDDTQDDGDKDDGSDDDDNNNNYQKRSNVDDISQSGFSNANSKHTKTRDASNNDHEDNDLLTQVMAAKPRWVDL